MEEDGTGSTDLGFGVSWEHGSALRNSSPQLGQQLLPAREIHRNPAWAARGSRGRTQRDIPARGFLDAQQHEPRVSLRDRSRAVGPRCARCQPDTPVTRGSACKARLPARPGDGAASPGREMERERLKAEPEARDRGAARPHLSGCTAGPGAASPPAAPAPQGAAGGSSRRMFCSSRCLLQLPRPPPDEIRPRGISGGCKTPPLPRACGPGRGWAGGTRWPLGAVPRPRLGAHGRAPANKGDGERSQALRARSAGRPSGRIVRREQRKPPAARPAPSQGGGLLCRRCHPRSHRLRRRRLRPHPATEGTPPSRSGRAAGPGLPPRSRSEPTAFAPFFPSFCLPSLLPRRGFAARFPAAHPAPQPR